MREYARHVSLAFCRSKPHGGRLGTVRVKFQKVTYRGVNLTLSPRPAPLSADFAVPQSVGTFHRPFKRAASEAIGDVDEAAGRSDAHRAGLVAMARTYAFGPFRLELEGDVLFRGVEPVAVGRRAVALLRVLVERPGVLITKDALIEAAWSGLAVEESNLSVQIAALRRALSAEAGAQLWIETLARRGYRYTGPAVISDFYK